MGGGLAVKCLCMLLVLVIIALGVPMNATAKIIAEPASMEVNGSTIGFVSAECDGKTVTVILSGFSGRMSMKNNKVIFPISATIVVNGKKVKAQSTWVVDDTNYIFTFKAKKLPDTILISPNSMMIKQTTTYEMTLVDDAYIPVEASASLGGYLLKLTTEKKLFKGKGNFTSLMADLHVGGDIWRKGSTLPKSLFRNSTQAQNMLLVPVTFQAIKGETQADFLQTMQSAQLTNGTMLYDLWHNDTECCFVFDTDAYAGKQLGVTVQDGVLTFGYTK